MRNCQRIFIMIIFLLFFYSSFCCILNAAGISHSYDPLNRLTQTVITDGSKTTTITYQYDAAGNMTKTERIYSGSSAITDKRNAIEKDPNELIDPDEGEMGNDVDLSGDED